MVEIFDFEVTKKFVQQSALFERQGSISERWYCVLFLC